MAGQGYKNDVPRDPLLSRLGAGQLDLSVHKLLSFPGPPADLARLLDLAGGPPEHVGAGLIADARLSWRVVAMARSSQPEGPPPTAAQAVEQLGADGAFQAVALQIAGDIFPAPGGGLPHEAFWTHSAAVGLAAGALARRAGGALPALAFAAGLLHDLGKAALNACLPKSYRRVLDLSVGRRGDIAEVERELLGTDHTVVGRRLARTWRLPEPVMEALWLHHQPAEAVPPMFASNRLIGLVQFADAIARREGHGFSGNFTFPTSVGQLAAPLAIQEDAIAEVVAEIAEALQRIRGAAAAGAERAPEPGPRTSPARPAPPEDHPEGPRIAAAMRDFAARAAETDDLPGLCSQIARTVHEALPTAASVLAFAIARDSAEAIVAVRTGVGETFRACPCRTDAPEPPSAAPAGRLLRGMLRLPQACDDLMDLDTSVCLPLVHHGRWVGGVVVPDDRRVAERLRGLLDLAAFALSAGLSRRRADQLAEQLVIASRRLAETRKALAEAETLAAVGEMAAGAAHEINNPLTVISGRAQLLAGRKGDPDAAKTADLISRKAEEISRIASDLMDFARPPAPEPTVVDLEGLLAGVKAQVEAWPLSKKPAPAVDIRIERDCPRVRIDAGQIEGVLLELVRNAAEAADGQVHVLLDAGSAGAPDRLLLLVVDDGAGMDEATLAAAFTPFFSHRPAGRGRGMGLARAKRTVQANGGSIRIESRPGHGTTVFVELPKA